MLSAERSGEATLDGLQYRFSSRSLEAAALDEFERITIGADDQHQKID